MACENAVLSQIKMMSTLFIGQAAYEAHSYTGDDESTSSGCSQLRIQASSGDQGQSLNDDFRRSSEQGVRSERYWPSFARSPPPIRLL